MWMTFAVTSQEINTDSLAARYLLINGSLNQYEYAYNQLLQMLSNQYPKSEVNTKGWQYL